jgi:hypothetical protein
VTTLAVSGGLLARQPIPNVVYSMTWQIQQQKNPEALLASGWVCFEPISNRPLWPPWGDNNDDPADDAGVDDGRKLQERIHVGRIVE